MKQALSDPTATGRTRPPGTPSFLDRQALFAEAIELGFEVEVEAGASQASISFHSAFPDPPSRRTEAGVRGARRFPEPLSNS
jgi:hypothetical protein